MKRAANTVLFIAVVATQMVPIGLASSARADDSTSREIRHQRRLLLQQQRQIEEQQREIDAQRRQLAQQGTAGVPAVSHGLFGDCPLGFTYYLVGGCQPDHAVIVYDAGSLRGR